MDRGYILISGGGTKMTNEQRISLQAHGLEDLPAIGRTVYIHRVEEHLQVDIAKGNQTHFVAVSKGQAYELATALIKALVNWEVEG